MTRNPFFKFDSLRWLSGSIRMYSLEHQALFVNAAAAIWMEGGLYTAGVEKLAEKCAPIECIREGKRDQIKNKLQELIAAGLLMQDTTGAISIKFLAEQSAEIAAYRQRQSRNVRARYSGKAATDALKLNSMAARDPNDPALLAFGAARDKTLSECTKKQAIITREEQRLIARMLTNIHGKPRIKGRSTLAINDGIEAAISEWSAQNG